MAITSPEKGWVTFNDYLCEMLGYSRPELLRRTWADLTHPDDLSADVRLFERVLRNEMDAYTLEKRFIRKDGGVVNTELSVRCTRHADGTVDHFLAILQDISHRKANEEELQRERTRLRLNEEYLRIFIDNAPAGVAMFDRDLRYLAYSRRWLSDYGIEGQDLHGRCHYEIFPEVPERWKEIHQRCLEGAKESCDEDLFVRADGSLQYLRWVIQPWRDQTGAVGGLVFFTEDISERVLSTLALRESEERFRVLIEDLDLGVLVRDPQDRVLVANRAARDILDIGELELGQITGRNYRCLYHEDGSEFPRDTVPSVMAARTKRPVRNVIIGIERPNSDAVRWLQVSAIPRLNERDELIHVLVSMSDISEKRLAERALRESEERLRTLNERFTLAVESAAIGVWELDLDSNELFWDRAMYAMYDVNPDEDPTPLAAWHRRIIPEDFDRVMKAAAYAIRHNKPYETEFRVIRRNGELRYLRSFGRTVHDVSGVPDRFIGISYDITRQRLLEEQLNQAEKMQAIGQLAGGIAHDFNNILTIINGYSDLLLASGYSSPENWREKVENIRHAGERAAMLTQQLLLFSRKAPRTSGSIDINATIRVMGGMLRRIIEEHIQLHMELTAAPAWANLDVARFEQILLNLCVNARDAMKDGGELHIRTTVLNLNQEEIAGHRGAQPGEYIRLEIADTGIGMSLHIQERIFEPFFTTKGVGHGTGLGLSTVYGVVNECSGFITVISAPGEGASFSVYLPAIAPPMHRAAKTAELQPGDGKRGKILVVEDEEPVREMIRTCLESAGFNVVTACNGVEAYDLFRDTPTVFDLLITDVIMPQRGGFELLRLIRQTDTELPVILISGYPGTAYDNDTATDSARRFVQKPFAPVHLLNVMDEMLRRGT